MTAELTDEQFLRTLEENIGIVMKISRAYTKTFHDREDLVNDIVLELWKSYKNFNSDSKISTWIYRVALNTSMNYKRKKKNYSVFQFIRDYKKVDGISWLTEQQQSEESDILYQCIDELNEINKAIILLYLDGKSYEEISEITGISKSNAGTRLGRIKEQIKSLATSKI